MSTVTESRYALSIIAAAAFLAGCGGSSMPAGADNAITSASAPKGHKTFYYTGNAQKFVVPSGVKQLTVVALGGEGGGFSVYPSTDIPGFPGRVFAVIPVRSGEKLYVFVGGSGKHNGFNGGGAGGTPSSGGYGDFGGGASDVRTGGDTLQNRIVVAAGGGGSGQAIDVYGYAYGGNGGGLVGRAGGNGGSDGISGGGGGGGTQRAGGAGGACAPSYSKYCRGQAGGDGALGIGGAGGSGACTGTGVGSYYGAGGGGGGGGGYYGGGGGGGGGYWYSCFYPTGQGGGGGGGSSYIEPSAITSRMWTGWKRKGDGLVVFSWN